MKKIFTLFCAITMATIAGFAQQSEEPMVAYLFTYFTGNAPHQEQICYALSDDGSAGRRAISESGRHGTASRSRP